MTGTARGGRRPSDGTLGPPGIDAILDAGIAAMAEQGYHGTSVRDIAERAGLSPAALYHHFASKQDLLATIMDRGIEELLRRTRAARDAATDPVARLRSLVDVHVRFHLQDQRGTLLGTSELRALEEPFRREHLGKRQQQQRVFDDTVAEGVRRGVFHSPFPREAARAIVVMCTGVAGWYKPHGRLSRDQVARRYQELALDLAGRRA
ncbi:TetR/AcrR family transcriptional regulator [Amycolatopsis rhizosphaerae]|uniref:TetR/AcrR family transcriptional regulator n=1 Tax=Amycolatopsis rhizosphaerae TaxID=2053003 RepID=A0A558CUR2_9PSEU|nr:TetR/AcrR family transcriptional regulator [Amycolatopsis rhizosphaerae]TVT52486.1 TetR/AcrR family transcriptional regulator [Amycolatopsis rhizosphaerae]